MNLTSESKLTMIYKLCFCSVVPALLFSVLGETWAQTPNWLWAHAIGGTWYDIGTSIAVDKENGDVYTAGYFYVTADFDTGPDIFNLNTDEYGAFISKTDSDGHFIWSKALSGTGYSSADAIALDQSGSGNVYSMGEFSGTIDFDPGPDIYNVTSERDKSIFILKLNSKGEFIWVKTITGSYNETKNPIALDPSGSGDFYITGNFNQTLDIDPGTEVFTIDVFEDIFIAKFDSSGHFLWVRTIGSPASTVITKSIAFDPSIDGGVYYTGYFFGTIDFNPGEEVYNITATGNNDVFISKLDRYGNFVWAKSMKGKNDGSRAKSTSIVIDPSESGGIYTTGDFWETIDFDPGGGTCKLTDGGIFISKLDSDGELIWAKALKGTDGYNSGYSIAIDDSGNGDIFITGLFTGKVDFDPGSKKFNINSVGLMNTFLSKLDCSGNFIWVKTMSGRSKSRTSSGLSVALDHAGNAYLTGCFNSADFAFDSIIVKNVDGKDPAQDGITNDIFIAKLGTSSPLPDKDSKSLHMTLTPNPTKDKLKIEYDNVDLHKALITVFNLAGEVMFSIPNEEIENKITIDISHLASGIYFIRLDMNGNRMTQKVFKE